MATRRRPMRPDAGEPRTLRWADTMGGRAHAIAATSAERRALPAPGSGTLLPTREPTPELWPVAVRGTSGRAGIYDELERQHGGIAAGAEDIVDAIGQADPEWQEHEAELPHETAFREDLGELLATVTPAEEQGATGWPGLAEALSMRERRGHVVLVPRWYASPASRYRTPGLNGLACELYPAHSSTIQRWLPGEHPGMLGGIEQRSATGMITLTRDEIIYLSRGGAPGEWEGISVLRPIVFLLLRWRELLLQTTRLAAMGGGTPVLRQTRGKEDTKNHERALTSLQEWALGGLPFLMLPAGYEIDVMAPASGDSVVEWLTYIDGRIDHVMRRSLATLGSTEHGSRALGEQAAASDAERQGRQLEAMLADFGRAFANWVAGQVGYTGRLPRLGQRAAAIAAASVDPAPIVAAEAAGLLGDWTVEDAIKLRSSLGLRSDGVTLAIVAPTPAPIAPTPVPPAPTGLADCGCGHAHRLSDAPLLWVLDARGERVQVPRELRGVETYVAWADVRRTREALDARLARELDAIAETHRGELRAVLARGPNPSAQAQVYDDAVPRYEAAIREHRQRMITEVERWATEEREAQRGTAAPVETAPEPARAPGMSSRRIAQTDAMVPSSARAIASRVQAEIEAAAVAGAPGWETAWRTAITAESLALPARQISQTIESEGRVAAALERDGQDGMRVVGVVQSTVHDTNRCDVCASRDGREFRFPEQRAAWEAAPLPDPDCKGRAERCRCGWLVIYGRDEAA